MNRTLNFLVISSIFALITCDKEKSETAFFDPTDHIISTLGPTMRLSIDVPGLGIYNFSSNNSALGCEGDLCNDFLVPESEMNELAQNLSDTIVFQWEFMTAESPYPENDCELLIFGDLNQQTGEYMDYMCSIGTGDEATNILINLSESLTGNARAALDEIVSHLLN
jgi:hypothetical protein